MGVGRWLRRPQPRERTESPVDTTFDAAEVSLG